MKKVCVKCGKGLRSDTEYTYSVEGVHYSLCRSCHAELIEVIERAKKEAAFRFLESNKH